MTFLQPSQEDGSAGSLLRLIRAGRATTRVGLREATGLGKATLAQRVDALIAERLVYEAGDGSSTGGRRPVVLAFNQDAGVVLAADLGATHSRIAAMNLAGTVLGEVAADLSIADGPDQVLTAVEKRFDEVLGLAERSAADVRGVGIGVPGPVEFASGRPDSPPIMPGWDGYPVRDRFVESYGVPVMVDNDVNIMALGEHYTSWSDCRDLLFVKVGTGIGCGIIAGGQVHRGAQGGAGDIGHILVAGHDNAVCSCGNIGCLESVAGGGAIARQLTEQGLEARDTRAVVRLVRSGNVQVIQKVREAGRLLGQDLASLVNFFNPSVIVIGGDLAQAHDQLFAGVREVVYQRSLPLATRQLRIERSALEDRAGVTGAFVMVIEQILSPEAVDIRLAAGGSGEKQVSARPARHELAAERAESSMRAKSA